VGKRLETARRGLVPAAIADMVNQNGLDSLQAKEVAALAKRYDVSPEEFEQQLSAVYSKYLRQLLSEEDGVKTAQIRELSALRRGIGLRWNATQAAHVAEAAALLDGEAPPPPSELPTELTALLWLSAGLFTTSKSQASTDSLASLLQLDERATNRVISKLSKPIYGRAVARACGKYNRTTAPDVLLTARKALCLTPEAAQQVHTEMFEAQLAMLLPDDDSTPSLGEEEMELLGELEGILQVRGAGAALRKRTEPLYRAAAAAALDAVLEGGPSVERPVSVWGRLALRQQQLNLPTDVARDLLSVESRRLASEKLVAAAELQAAGKADAALAEANKVVEYAGFLGDMLTAAALESGDDVAERYLGALALPAAETALQELCAAMGDTPLTAALFSRVDAGLQSARAEYLAALEACASKGAFDDTARKANEARAASLGLAPSLAEQIGRDVYYGWLTDVSERGKRDALEQCADVRSALGVASVATAELYSTTEVDELVLSACCEQMLREEGPGLSQASGQWLQFLEGQLAARPGTAAAVITTLAPPDA